MRRYGGRYDVSRRDVLKGVVFTWGGAAVHGSLGSQSPSGEGFESSICERLCHRRVSDALADERVRRLWRRFVEGGWTPRVEEARTTTTDEGRAVVAIPVGTDELDEGTAIVWMEDGDES